MFHDKAKRTQQGDLLQDPLPLPVAKVFLRLFFGTGPWKRQKEKKTDSDKNTERERRRCRTDLKIRDSRVWNVKIRVCNAIDKKQSIYIEYQCERVPKFTHPWCRWLDWTSYKRWILGRIGNRKLYLFRKKKEHIRPRKNISKRSLEIITQRPKISSRLQSLFFQGIQECPVPATLPSCSAWTWYFRKPNTSGSLSIRVVVLTTFTYTKVVSSHPKCET